MKLINSHDRERVLALAEEFVEEISRYEDHSEVTDITLDQCLIIGICGITINNAEQEIELPVHVGSTRRPYVQRGILESVLDRIKLPDGRFDDE
jgi:hypothetical protein